MTKQIGKMLIGAVVGFVVMYILLNLKFNVYMPFKSIKWMILFMVVSILLLIFSLFGYIKIKEEAKKQVSGDEEDERDKLQNKRYGDIVLAANVSMYFSLAMLALVATTVQHNAFVFISLALILVSLSLGFVYLELVKTINPNRDIPTVNDKQFAKKLLEMSDEGERHIMLQGMYRAFTSINPLLFFAVLALIAYSIISGVSQLFGIFTILLILVIINAQYMLTIRKK